MVKRPIKVVKIKGGLGNQLFCLAFSQYLKNLNNIKLLIDSSSSYFLTEQFGRKFELKNLLSKDQFLKNTFLIIIFKILYKINNKLTWISKKYNSLSLITTEAQYQKRGCKSKFEYFDGYWQDKKYIESGNNDFIRKLIEFTEIKDKKISNKTLIGLHYRIKEYDYKLSQKYYLDGLKYIVEKNKIPEYLIFIFTDEYEKAEEFFKNLSPFRNAKIISGKVLDDFKLMCSCDHFIIAKSTLSWWVGIILQNKNKNPTICRPNFFEFSDSDKLSIEGWVTINE